MHGNEHTPPREKSSSPLSYHPTIITSASFSAISHHNQISTHSSNLITSNQTSRRQTIDSNSSIINPAVDEDLMCYLNQSTESTRF
jgi:hypothetical protein